MLDASQIFDGTLPNIGAPITTSRASTNILNWLIGRDVGAGDDLGLHCQVTQAFVGGTSLQVSYQVAAAPGGPWVDLLETAVILTSNLILGKNILRFTTPLNQPNNTTNGINNTPGQYSRLFYTVVGTYTAGAVMAYMNPAPDRNVFHAYAANYNVTVPAAEL